MTTKFHPTKHSTKQPTHYQISLSEILIETHTHYQNSLNETLNETHTHYQISLYEPVVRLTQGLTEGAQGTLDWRQSTELGPAPKSHSCSGHEK